MVGTKGCHLEQDIGNDDTQARTTIAGNIFEHGGFVNLVRFHTLYMDTIYRLN